VDADVEGGTHVVLLEAKPVAESVPASTWTRCGLRQTALQAGALSSRRGLTRDAADLES
jgi:hypothetical protein